MILCVDTILWIYLQNVISLPYDYLIETDTFEIFHTACEKSSKFSISANEIYDDLYTSSTQFQFDSFITMIKVLQNVLPVHSKKKELVDRALPIIERMHLEVMLGELSFNSKM
jgi:hypothetical protein